MKLLQWGIALCSLCLFTACNNNTDKNTHNEDSVTIAPPVEDMNNTTTVDTANINGSAVGTMDTANVPGTTTSESRSSAVNNNRSSSTRRTAKDNRTGFEKTGQYNSDQKVPEPLNLDDKKYRKHPPAHTYGDTSPHNDGLNSTR